MKLPLTIRARSPASRSAFTLAEIMTDNVMCLSPHETLRDAVEMFERYSFRAIPITDENDRLVSVVSYRDIKGIKPRLH